MKQLATLTDADITEGATNKLPDNFFKRQAARAIVLNDNGQVYLLHMSNYGYHKLPGGGVDDGEDMPTALFRELKEEIGCPAEITGEVGEIRELRSEMEWDQASYCYLAKQNGELMPTELEPSEIEQGAQTVIADSIDAAIELLEKDSPTDYEGRFIKQRDLIFLRRANELIQLQ